MSDLFRPTDFPQGEIFESPVALAHRFQTRLDTIAALIDRHPIRRRQGYATTVYSVDDLEDVMRGRPIRSQPAGG